MADIIRVVAGSVDTAALTLYLEDGTTRVVMQGDPNLARIVKEITPGVLRGEVVEVHMTPPQTVYAEYEQQSGGLVKFFRVAKSALKSLFGVSEPVVQVESGLIGPPVKPVVAPAITVSPFIGSPDRAAEDAQTQRIMNATQAIIAHAETVASNDPQFHDKNVGEGDEHTVVAVVETKQGPAVIPNAQKLKSQLNTAVALGSPEGMNAFFKRVASVNRQHSVEDLLRFMERGDLPVADDGCIVIYKVLKKHIDGGYVDCHTKRVRQRVGSYVFMNESLVDHNRANECSNGLHVARRQYIGGFNGDVVVLAKLRPEDVIAVPNYDANKMRVCGYHILCELSAEAYYDLRNNKPFTSNEENKRILGWALAGQHPPYDQTVEICGPRGTDVKVIDLNVVAEVVTPTTEDAVGAVVEQRSVEAIDLNANVDEVKAPALDPKALASTVVEAKKEVVKSRSEQARDLYITFNKAKNKSDRSEAAEALMTFKKSKKVGWDKLGITEAELEKIEANLPKRAPTE